MFMLIDCDNFFVSCERIFRPDLKHKPVVVLSNNDGCVISRSYEAKALGIPMGCPYFKVKDFFTSQKGVALSGHHGLYSDISRRVMGILKTHYDETEIYSIDESFVKIPENADAEQEALNIHRLLLQQTGISASVGVARTKTLCKAASDIAKKKEKDKVHLLVQENDINHTLSDKDVAGIWGIGKHTADKLHFLGFITALELKNAPQRLIRKSLGINIERIVTELNQIPCIESSHDETQQSFVCSRSFEHEIKELESLKSILAEFTDNVCRRLRRQNAAASALTVFIETNRFSKKCPYYHNSQPEILPESTDNTARFMTALSAGLKKIYRPGLEYKRAGVMLSGIESLDHRQESLFITPRENTKEQKLMQAFDILNKKLGTNTVFFGLQHPEKQLKTSCGGWNALVQVK